MDISAIQQLVKSNQTRGTVYVLVFAVAVFLRVMIGFFPYSGEGDKPLYGDYEAQRHWKELTISRPPSQWYLNPVRDNTVNPWPLDYPPLTAYHEYLLGLASRWLDPASVAPGSSRGYEEAYHRIFMRMTVLASELAIYFPAVVLLVQSLTGSTRWTKFCTFTLLVLNPVLIFVDHGHFQYNSVALGLLVFAIAFIQRDRPYVAAAFFTMSFLFKQTLLYFSPMFFAFMVGQAVRLGRWRDTARRICTLAVVVLGIIAVAVAPLLIHCSAITCVKGQVSSTLASIFPFGRGLFEGYVANMWISISPLLRLRQGGGVLLKSPLVGTISALSTFAGFSEACWYLGRKPNPALFPIGLTATSMSFFLFSWMVHEKAILLPTTALIAAFPALVERGHATVLLRLTEGAILSLVQLMVMDYCVTGAVPVCIFALIILRSITGGSEMLNKRRPVSIYNKLATLTNCVALVSAIAQFTLPTVARAPHLWFLLLAVSCCATFVLCWRQMISILKHETKLKV